MTDRLNPGGRLHLFDELESASKNVSLRFQGDGNLVLRVHRFVGSFSDWVVRWASGTNGRGAETCDMQADGNLVIRDGAGKTLWESRTRDPVGNPGSWLVVQDDENAVIQNPGGVKWATNTWIADWVVAPFNPADSGLRFRNFFADANYLGVPSVGLCGGMTFTMLDYHYAGRPASRVRGGAPTQPPTHDASDRMGAYVKARQVDSLANVNVLFMQMIATLVGIPPLALGEWIVQNLAAVPSPNLHRFLAAQAAADRNLRAQSFETEWPKLRAAIDAGKPVPIGLISRSASLISNHQAVAYGYKNGVRDRWIRVLDPNHPGQPHEIWVSEDHDLVESDGSKWRGFFVEDYAPQSPPRLGIDDAKATDPRVFDAGFYLRSHEDLANAFGGDQNAARSHWLDHGVREGRSGSIVLDPEYYLTNHPDLVAAYESDNYESAIRHFIDRGILEARRSSYQFDMAWYLANHADLLAAFGAGNHAAAVDHWIRHGLDEGRRSSADFDVRYYLGAHPDLVAAFGAGNYRAAFEHWVRYGRAEGRRTVP